MGISKTHIIKCQPEGSFVEDHYEMVRTLGIGGFGTVNLVRERNLGSLRVCKQVDTSNMNRDVMELVKREVILLSTLDHPWIVKLYEFANDPLQDKLLLILEYVDQGDAQALRKKSGGRLKEAVVARLIHQVFVALAYCHFRGVIHRDIKPENMMLTRSWDGMTYDCKLIDFGVAAFRHSTVKEIAGSPAYMAPEVVSRTHSGCDTQSDIFSVGASALELLTGKLPFGSVRDHGGRVGLLLSAIRAYRRQSFNVVEQRVRKSQWTHLSDGARQCVRSLLDPRPSRRPTAADAVHSTWLQLHRAQYSGLTSEMVPSMISYAQAQPVLKCCLFIVAARTDHDNQDLFSAQFLSIDTDGDGFISLLELDAALKAVNGLGENRIEALELFDAMDLSHKGKVSFTEFVAACLSASYESTEGLNGALLRSAFAALDTDRDGLVSLNDDILPYFNQRSIQGSLRMLPQDRLFDEDEWHDCLRDVETNSTACADTTFAETELGTNSNSVDTSFASAQEDRFPAASTSALNFSTLLRFLALCTCQNQGSGCAAAADDRISEEVVVASPLR